MKLTDSPSSFAVPTGTEREKSKSEIVTGLVSFLTLGNRKKQRANARCLGGLSGMVWVLAEDLSKDHESKQESAEDPRQGEDPPTGRLGLVRAFDFVPVHIFDGFGSRV